MNTIHAWIYFSCAKHERLWTCFLEVPQTCLKSSGKILASRNWVQRVMSRLSTQRKGNVLLSFALISFRKKTPHNRSLDLICLYPLKRKRGVGKIDSIPDTLVAVVLLLRCHCSSFLKDIKRAPGKAVHQNMWKEQKNLAFSDCP